jgi:hypothetical protein
VDKQDYLKKRMRKALEIANELGYMIEHVLGVTAISNNGKLTEFMNINDFFNDVSNGPKLFNVMKSFIDVALQVDEEGNAPQSLIDKYIENISEFSLNPIVTEYYLEFTIQEYSYRIEIIMDMAVAMTVMLDDKFLQNRLIKEVNDFAGIMKIMNIIRNIFISSPFDNNNEKELIEDFYNKIKTIANSTARGWEDIEIKDNKNYSLKNDIYFSPYNYEEFMSDLKKEIIVSRKNTASIKDIETKVSFEKMLDFLINIDDDFSVSNQKISEVIVLLKNNKMKDENFFKDLFGRISKKHNTVERLKLLVNELETFSDLETVEEFTDNFYKEYGYETVKEYLMSNNKEKFLEKVVMMTVVDRVKIADFILKQTDSFFQDRAGIFLQVITRDVVPINLEGVKRISSILSSDPIQIIKELNPEIAKKYLENKEIDIPEINEQEVENTLNNLNHSESVREKYQNDLDGIIQNIAENVFEEMDELVEKGLIKGEESTEKNINSEYLEGFLTKAFDKIGENEMFQKIMKEAIVQK